MDGHDMAWFACSNMQLAMIHNDRIGLDWIGLEEDVNLLLTEVK